MNSMRRERLAEIEGLLAIATDEQANMQKQPNLTEG